MEELFKNSMFDILNKCFVCGEYMDTFKNELSVPTGYSEKTVLQILEIILDISIPKDHDVVQKGGICQNCFIKFNEYDEVITRAEAIKSDLICMITSREKCKVEEVEIDEEIIYTDFDENMVEYSEIPENFNLVTEEVDMSKEVDREMKGKGFVVSLVDSKSFECEICHKTFISRHRLKAHQLIHTEERKYKCTQCGAGFKILNGLKNHLKLHMNIFFHCDLCARKFKGKHELRCHLEAIHLGRKDHVCKLCGKAFSRDKTLRQHLLYHDNKRDVECEICGFRAINMPKLKRHLKSHSKQRDYSCSICNKRFLYSYNVTAHIKFVHWKQKRNSTDDSKLKCYVCGKKYQKIWKVKEHMREEHKIIEEITLINE